MEEKKERRWKFLHPLAEKVASLFKRSSKEEANIRELLKKERGIYLMNVEDEKDSRLTKTSPRVVIIHPEFMSALLNELGSENEKKVRSAINKLLNVARRGEKAITFLPLQQLYLEAAWNIYKRLKEELGDRLKSFAVTGSVLTGNVDGVPIKVRKIENLQKGETKDVVHFGVLDDLDLVVVVDKLSEEEKNKIRQLIEEEIRKSGLPSNDPSRFQEGILDDSMPFILDSSDIKNLAHYFHEEKPVLFFDKEHLEWASNLLENENFREFAKKEAEEYRKKKQFYRERMDQLLEDVFKKELEKIETGEKPSREIRVISENLPTFLQLFQSTYFRDNLDRLMWEYMKEARERGIPPAVANERLRRALAAVIKRYMEASANIYKTAQSGELLDRFDIYRKVKEFYKNTFKKAKG